MTQPCKQAGPDLLERDKGPSLPLMPASLPFPLPGLLFLEIGFSLCLFCVG